ncbi:TPA: DUF826 domain-containing protein [Escherichia coli]|nr:DUF826 domain-containing protein [Escherichia coli]
MAEAKTAVTGLVTDDVLKQALATREVLNPLKMAVKKVLSEQIDKEVENLLVSLTGQAADNAVTKTGADDGAERKQELAVTGSTVTEINTGDVARSGEQVPETTDAAQPGAAQPGTDSTMMQ